MPFLRLALTILRLAATEALRHAAVSAGLWITAMLAFLVGGIGLMVALWIGLARMLDPLLASLLIGAVGIASGIILLLIVRLRRAKPLFPTSATDDLKAALGEKGAGVEVWAPVLALALLGFVLASKGKADDPADT